MFKIFWKKDCEKQTKSSFDSQDEIFFAVYDSFERNKFWKAWSFYDFDDGSKNLSLISWRKVYSWGSGKNYLMTSTFKTELKSSSSHSKTRPLDQFNPSQTRSSQNND